MTKIRSLWSEFKFESVEIFRAKSNIEKEKKKEKGYHLGRVYKFPPFQIYVI